MARNKISAKAQQRNLNKVVHGTLSKDKTTGSGVGTFPGGKFTFTKR
jgi:hypothetical protein